MPLEAGLMSQRNRSFTQKTLVGAQQEQSRTLASPACDLAQVGVKSPTAA